MQSNLDDKKGNFADFDQNLQILSGNHRQFRQQKRQVYLFVIQSKKTSIDFFERVREDKTFQLIINPFNTIEIIS